MRAARFRAIQAILHSDWDPIGCGVPLDEYDTYVWRVLRLLMREVPRTEVEAYLDFAARDLMNSPVPEERVKRVVDALLSLA